MGENDIGVQLRQPTTALSPFRLSLSLYPQASLSFSEEVLQNLKLAEISALGVAIQLPLR